MQRRKKGGVKLKHTYFCSHCDKSIDFENIHTFVSLKGSRYILCEKCIEIPDTELDTFFDNKIKVDVTISDDFNENPEPTHAQRPKTKNISKTGNYKCVAAHKTITIFKNGDYESAANYFSHILNREAAAGWRFVSMEQVTTYKPAGCLAKIFGQEFAAIFGQQAVGSSFNMLIFERK